MLAQRLKELRNRKKRTQQDVAKYLGLTRPAYTAYESGSRNPDYDTLIKIADYFDVTTDYLLGRMPSTEAVKEDGVGNPKDSLSIEGFNILQFKDLGLDEEKIRDLTPYQQEVLDWAINEDALFFKNKSDNVLDMMERLEIAYEVNKAIEKREKNNKKK